VSVRGWFWAVAIPLCVVFWSVIIRIVVTHSGSKTEVRR